MKNYDNAIGKWIITRIMEEMGEEIGRVWMDQAKEGTPNPSVVMQKISQPFFEYLGERCNDVLDFTYQVRAYECTRQESNKLRNRIRCLFHDLECGRHTVTCDGEEYTFFLERSRTTGDVDTYDKKSNAQGDDYGSIMLLEICADFSL